MKKHTTITVFLTDLFVMLSLLLPGCENIMSPNIPQSGKGTVTVFLSAAGRSALAPEGMDFDSYAFTFTGEDGGEPVYEEKTKGQAFTFSLNLDEEYTLKVEAYKDSVAEGNLAATGTTEPFTVTVNTPVTVKLKGFQKDGPLGQFSYAITYPDGTDIEELVLLTDEDNIIDLTDEAGIDIGSEAVSGTVNLAAGWYFLILRLSLDGKETGYANGVAIYSGQTTCYGTELEPIEFEEGDFNIPSVKPGDPDTLAGQLLILQTYVPSNDPAGISHPFVELYNTTDTVIDLDGITLYFADGTASVWNSIPLDGHTIPAEASFLTMGQKASTTTGTRLILEEGYGDINDPAFTMTNNGYKIAIIRNTGILDVPNPFDMGGGAKAAGYIDMIGTYKDAATDVTGYETAPARGSASEAVRRGSLDDTDNNSTDFIRLRYATDSSTGIYTQVKPWNIDFYMPKNSAYNDGEGWDPFDEPEEPPVAGSTLMIWQIGAATDGNLSRSFVELYNNSDAEIVLDTYSIQYSFGFSTNAAGNGNPAAEGGSTTNDGPWTKVGLTGTIQPRSSFLILGPEKTTASGDSPPALAFSGDSYGDMYLPAFELNNRAVKVVLLSNQTQLERSVQNPFTADDGSPVSGYVDMIGVTNSNPPADNINGYETNRGPSFSKQVGIRRKTLTDTNDNTADFESVRFADYVTKSGSAIIAYSGEYEVKRPKNSAYGAWNPITGVRELQMDAPGAFDPLAGELLILQAFSSHSEAAGVSHTFVELYNTKDEPIDLTGISLYYANGTRNTADFVAEVDGPWGRIDLAGKTIPAKASFLIMGPYLSVTAIHQIPNNYGDINIGSSDVFNLSNRAFKVALIRRTTPLYVQNPFDIDGDGSNDNVGGYIDMVGAKNRFGDGDRDDTIYGYETVPARCSGSESVRRKNLIDTDDNSEDFIQARYARNISDLGVYPMTPEEIEICSPKNSAYGAWNPITGEKEPPHGTGDPDPLEGKLLILQAYGTGGTGQAGVNRSFVELYNTTNTDIPLSGITLYYADGNNTSTADYPWETITLSESIPSKASYLVLGRADGNTARYNIPAGYGDINDDDFILSNRAFKVALIRGTETLTVQNPFDVDDMGTKVTGYIDMVGAANTYGTDTLLGFETLPARNSGSEAVRRINPIDTDNNRGPSATFPTATGDFTSVRYGSGSGMITDEELEVRRPRNSTDTTAGWDPFAAPEEPPPNPEPPVSETILILQANTYGNNNGGNAGFARSLVELYNVTGAAINLTGGNYYLHIGDATTWTNVIKLEGSIPANSSFLVVDNTAGTSGVNNATPRAPLPAADQEAAFIINNTNFKVALFRNLTVLSVDDPFTEESLFPDYIDMLGTGNANAKETQTASASRPQGPRRISLIDTNNNSVDFRQADFRGTATGNVADNELYKIWPRNSSLGPWDPITGEPEVNPFGEPHEPTGNTLLIFQAAAPNNNASNPITYSFVELYNAGDEGVPLTGYSLQWADGDATSWNVINLSGVIQPSHSFLIQGKQTSTNTSPALNIPAGYGDINDATLELSNRAFKVVLLSNQTPLTGVANPFNTGSGSPVAGYVDMLGATNDGVVNGYETTAKTGLSRNTGIRRTSLTDTDNNANDFEAFHYGNGSAAEIAAKRPRNSKTDGAWEPFEEPGDSTIVGAEDALAKKLLIFHAYGGDGRSGGPTHHFVELYNTTDATVSLTGYSLQFAASGSTTNWTVINLTGSVPAKSSYLIRGTSRTNVATPPRIDLSLVESDVTGSESTLSLSNNGFKIALIKSTDKLTVANPFRMDEFGGKAAGYVDMVGAMNTYSAADAIGEGTFTSDAFPRNSHQEGVRRKNLTDTDVNANDFVSVRYTSTRADNANGIDDYELNFYTPKNTASGTWDPLVPPVDPDTQEPPGITLEWEKEGEVKYTTIVSGGDLITENPLTIKRNGTVTITPVEFTDYRWEYNRQVVGTNDTPYVFTGTTSGTHRILLKVDGTHQGTTIDIVVQ